MSRRRDGCKGISRWKLPRSQQYNSTQWLAICCTPQGPDQLVLRWRFASRYPDERDAIISHVLRTLRAKTS